MFYVCRMVFSRGRYHLLVEGYGLAAVMGAPGIDGSRTRSNHIIEVNRLHRAELRYTDVFASMDTNAV